MSNIRHVWRKIHTVLRCKLLAFVVEVTTNICRPRRWPSFTENDSFEGEVVVDGMAQET